MDTARYQESALPFHLNQCTLCPRRCGVDRVAGRTGFCRSTATMRVARAALHMWEEPCISGTEGSGTVFFTGCSLRCRFCQNTEISGSHSLPGIDVTPSRLAEIFLKLQSEGANNINLVTAGHHIIPCAESLRTAKEHGLTIPVVYNSSGYELPEALRLLDGLVDVYLPDFKFMDPDLALQYCSAADYPDIAKSALEEMLRQMEKGGTEGALFDARGIMTHGVIVRQLLLPGHVSDAKKIIEYLYHTYRDRIWISMMSQYTPMSAVEKDPLLGRRVTKREYDRLVDYALSLGVANAFIQERKAAADSFIPSFHGEGVL